MPAEAPRGLWTSGDAYEPYAGRWSRLVAAEFVDWIGVAPGARWLDVGCGTGALCDAILAAASPSALVGVEPSPAFLAHVRGRLGGGSGRFLAGDAGALPLGDGGFDAVVSGLVLDFLAEPAAAIAEMARVAAPDGVVAAYVWDDGGGTQMWRAFWDAARELGTAAGSGSAGHEFPVSRPDTLAKAWRSAGLATVATRAVDVATVFAGFDDYWSPFLGAGAPAPEYLRSLDDERRTALRELLRSRLRPDPDGAIRLTARAWAVRGRAQR